MKKPIIFGSLILVTWMVFKDHLSSQFVISEANFIVEMDREERLFLTPLIQRVRTHIQRWKGKSLIDLPVEEIQSLLEEQDWIASFRVYRHWPNSFSVEVQPTATPLVLIDPRGKLRPITTEGDLLGVVSSTLSPDAPILAGQGLYTNLSLRRTAVDLVASLPPRGALAARNISEITFEASEGFSLHLIDPKIEVLLGLEEPAIRVLRAAAVVDYLESHNQTPAVIDANFSKKVLVRLRKHP